MRFLNSARQIDQSLQHVAIIRCLRFQWSRPVISPGARWHGGLRWTPMKRRREWRMTDERLMKGAERNSRYNAWMTEDNGG